MLSIRQELYPPTCGVIITFGMSHNRLSVVKSRWTGTPLLLVGCRILLDGYTCWNDEYLMQILFRQ